MKRLYIFLILISACILRTNAQEKYFPEGTWWEVIHFNATTPLEVQSISRYETKGDSIINGRKYKKIVIANHQQMEDVVALFREEGEKIYMHQNIRQLYEWMTGEDLPENLPATKDMLLYDFDWTSQDTLYRDILLYKEATIVRKPYTTCNNSHKVVLSDGKEYDMIGSMEDWKHRNKSEIRTIGSLENIVRSCAYPELTSSSKSTLLSFHRNGVHIYQNPDFPLEETREDWIPLLEDGKSWIYSCMHFDEILDGYLIHEVEGDTVVNGVTYQKVYATFNSANEAEVPSRDKKLYYLGREENGKMYFYTDSKEFCFFDFNHDVGDTFSFAYDNYRMQNSGIFDAQGKVTEVTSIESADGVQRKVLKVRVSFKSMEDGQAVEHDWDTYTYIEGIGLADLGIDLGYNIGMTGGRNPLLRCVHNASNHHLWGNNEECTAGVPNDIDKIEIPVHDSNKISANTVYNLSGRKLMQKPQKGFYIQGGKKFLQK